MLEFYQIGCFPGITECIDCTHVRIKSPGSDTAEVFHNAKGVFSINVQESCIYSFQHAKQDQMHTNTVQKVGFL